MVQTPYRPPEPSDEKPRSPTTVFLKWLAICGVSAGPSFVFALGLTTGVSPIDEILGMLAGIFCFVLAYTFAELRPATQRLMSDRRIRLTARIGYGIRVAMSIAFPISMFVDLWIGLISVGITSSFHTAGEPPGGFLWHFVTTIVQGILLNIVLLALMLFIYVIVLAVYRNPPAPASNKKLPVN